MADFNEMMEKLITTGEKMLSFIYRGKENVKDSILLDSIMEAQLYISNREMKRQRRGVSVVDVMMEVAAYRDVPEEMSGELFYEAGVLTALALPRLEQRIRDGMGDDPCAYFNSIRLKYPYKRERKRPPRRSDRAKP